MGFGTALPIHRTGRAHVMTLVTKLVRHSPLQQGVCDGAGCRGPYDKFNFYDQVGNADQAQRFLSGSTFDIGTAVPTPNSNHNVNFSGPAWIAQP